MDKFAVVMGAALLLMLFIVGFALLFAIPTMLLWNWLMPMLFGLTQIGFWEALGINMLSGFLFKSSGSCSCRSD